MDAARRVDLQDIAELPSFGFDEVFFELLGFFFVLLLVGDRFDFALALLVFDFLSVVVLELLLAAREQNLTEKVRDCFAVFTRDSDLFLESKARTWTANRR